MPLNDDVKNLLTTTGVAAAGTLKENVDALCTATGIPFSSMKDTVDALKLLIAWSSEVMPKIVDEVGLEATGKLTEDVKAMRKEMGVAESKLYLELGELCDSLGVTSEKKLPLMRRFPAPKVTTAKVVEAPCVCTKGTEACRDCHAKEHPCVCERLCDSIDQPVIYCKAKVHECICEHRFEATFSFDPGIEGVKPCSYTHKIQGYIYGAKVCRQHNVIDVDDSDDDEVKPAKKKVKKERRGKK
eukprot:CAMPEP_0119272064 /NCGR_PEP_ID=MMETSP1329-20130426/8393_1 /TAXON_ID=114041 /ORGANISM="Genus nov. species nov., Strain RCC1024" /LENGTH=242 /DNA_ID=CAMNT_0007272117 /DNA_START=234 /DNA_END=962 /DNA_ORIENTATION=+